MSGTKLSTRRFLLLAVFVVASQSAADNPSLAREAAEKLPAVNANWQSSQCRTCNLSSAYPVNWHSESKPDKDTAVKISGTLSDGSPAEIALKQSDSKDLSAETISKIFEDAYLKKLSDYKMLSSKNIVFGEGWHFNGIDKQVTFDTNGTNFRQRFVFFDGPEGVLIFTFSAPAASFDKLQTISNQVAMSVKKAKVSTSDPKMIPQAPVAWTFESMQTKTLPLAFSYPKGWQTEIHSDRDHPLSIHGADSSGKPGSIEVHCGDAPPSLGIEPLATIMEEKYFSDLKNYRRVKEEPISFGSMNNLQGVVHEMTFGETSQSMTQMALFFLQDARVYSFSLTCGGWKDNEVRALFHKIVATIKITSK